MAEKWIYITDALPANNESCYLRLANNEYYPHKADYDTNSQSFFSATPLFEFQLNQVLKWKSAD